MRAYDILNELRIEHFEPRWNKDKRHKIFVNPSPKELRNLVGSEQYSENFRGLIIDDKTIVWSDSYSVEHADLAEWYGVLDHEITRRRLYFRTDFQTKHKVIGMHSNSGLESHRVGRKYLQMFPYYFLDKRGEGLKPPLKDATGVKEAARIGTAIHKNEIPEKYRKYPLISRGTTSAVLDKGDGNVLMLTKDGVKKDWIVNELELGEFVEGIETHHPKMGEGYIYVIEMPMLYPLDKKNKKMARDLSNLVQKMIQKSGGSMNRMWKYDVINNFYEYFEEWDQNNADPHVLQQLIDFIANYDPEQYEWDVRQGNFMQDAEGNIVVLDPIASKEILDVFRK